MKFNVKIMLIADALMLFTRSWISTGNFVVANRLTIIEPNIFKEYGTCSKPFMAISVISNGLLLLTVSTRKLAATLQIVPKSQCTFLRFSPAFEFRDLIKFSLY